MASTQLIKEISSLQANTLLPALENCLLEVDAACTSGRQGISDNGNTWLQACTALLEHGAVLAQASSFLQLEVTQLLQRHLEKRPRLAEALLCTQLRVFLQHPVALQQLLRAVPSNQTSQSLVYSSLCTSLTPGGQAMQWPSPACKGQALQVVRSCASWELQKLVAEPSSTSSGRVKLAGQLPWLLHLLLLTDCAQPEGGDAPGSSYGSACDDDSAARSEGTNHGGVPSGSGREGTLSADHASSGGPMRFPPRGRQNRESANFSIMSTSEPTSGVDSEVHGLHMDSGCLASLDPLGTDQAPLRAAATVLAHLRHCASLCSLLGLMAEPNLGSAQKAQDDSTFAPSLSGPDARGWTEEATPLFGLLSGGQMHAAPELATLHERLAVTKQLTEVLLQALLLPNQVTEGILGQARAAVGPGSAGEEDGKGSGDCSKESSVLDLLTVHMQLVSMQQSHQAPGTAAEQTEPHLGTEARLGLLQMVKAAMQKQEPAHRRTHRRTSSASSGLKDREGLQSCVAPEVAAHALALLAAAPGLGTRGSDDCGAAPVSGGPNSSCNPEGPPGEANPQNVVARALTLALAMYGISLGGPLLGVTYESSQAAAFLDAAVTKLQERLGGPELTPAQPGSLLLEDIPAAPATGLLGKRERQERACRGSPYSEQQPSVHERGSCLELPSAPSREQSASGLSKHTSAPASEAQAPAKKRRIVPEAVSAPERLTGQSVDDTRTLQSQRTRSEGAAVAARSECAGSERLEDGESAGESGGEEEASPLLQRGMLADQEKEAWWEHYIAVKLDLVENVLNDDVAPEDDVGCPMMTPSAADDVSTPMPGMRRGCPMAKGTPSGAVASSMSHRRMVVADLAFKEPSWQAMHAAALQLLTNILRAARGGEAEQRDALLRPLSEAAPEAEVLASVRNACLLIQPSCGMDTYQAAISGAKAAPQEALPVFFAVRMGRYLSGVGEPPEPELAAAYLAALESLNELAGESTPLSAVPPSAKKGGGGKSRGKQTPPRQLLAKLLLALLDCGDIAIGRSPPGADSAKRLIRLVLAGFPAPHSAVLAASALVGLSQGMLDLKRRRPHWASAFDAGWHDAWFNAAETAEPAAAVAAAEQLLRTVAAGFAADAGAFRVSADVVIMACRAAECWEGLEAEEMEGTLTELLQLGAAVQAQCTAATAQLLQMLTSPPGCEGSNAKEQGARANSIAAAYGPDLAESLLSFCQWLSKTRPGFQIAQVVELEWQAMLGCKAGHSMLLEHLAAAASKDAGTGATEAPISLQAQVCEWLGEAYEDMAAHGVASAEAEPDQDADDSALTDSALTDHSMQTDDQKTDDARDGPRTAGKAPKQRKRSRSSNPFVQAAMAEMAMHWGNRFSKRRAGGASDGGDVSGDDVSGDSDDDNGDDLDDFVVCKPGRDYRTLFAQQFKYSCAEMPRSLFRRPL